MHKMIQRGPSMRALTLDDDLLLKAQQVSGLTERGQLIRKAFLALVQRESARRLALLGGSEPQLHAVPRRQAKSA